MGGEGESGEGGCVSGGERGRVVKGDVDTKEQGKR